MPLKTYLPDGDIDLTAFSNNQNLKDTWAYQVRDMLEKEEKNDNAEFHVKEVQYIQAEVSHSPCHFSYLTISFLNISHMCILTSPSIASIYIMNIHYLTLYFGVTEGLTFLHLCEPNSSEVAIAAFYFYFYFCMLLAEFL